MRMNVDETGEDDNGFGVRGSRLAVRAFLSTVGRTLAGSANGNDPSAIDFDPAVADWLRIDGQNPRGAVNAGHAYPRGFAPRTPLHANSRAAASWRAPASPWLARCARSQLE